MLKAKIGEQTQFFEYIAFENNGKILNEFIIKPLLMKNDGADSILIDLHEIKSTNISLPVSASKADTGKDKSADSLVLRIKPNDALGFVVTYCNRSNNFPFLLSVDYIIDNDLKNILIEDLYYEIENRIYRVLQNQSERFEYLIDSKYYFFRLTPSKTDNSGNVTEIFCSAFEVKDSKIIVHNDSKNVQHFRKIKEKIAIISGIMNSSFVGMLLCYEDNGESGESKGFVIEKCNRYLTEIFNADYRDIEGKFIEQLFTFADKNRITEIYNEIKYTSKVFESESYQKINGKSYWFRYQATYIEGGFFITFIDITSKISNELTLIEKEIIMNGVGQITQLGAFSINIKTKEIVWSDENFTILGLKNKIHRIDSKIIAEIVHADDVELLKENYRNCVENDYPLNTVFRVRSSLSETVAISVFGKKIRDFDGNPDRIIGIFMNVTEKVFAENIKRKAELKLQTVSKLATLGKMVSGIIHEISQPFNYLNCFVHNLRTDITEDKFNPERTNQSINHAEHSLNRINLIISHVKDFSYSNQAELRQVYPVKVLENSLIILNQVLKRKNINLVYKLLDEIPMVLANENQLEQIYINIIQNSIDSFDNNDNERNIIITFSSSPEDDFVCIEIADNGKGIPEEIRSRIFEPFFTTKSIGKGTGLGLSIVKNILNNFRGDIRFNSETDNGSKFVIKLMKFSINNQIPEKNTDILF